MIVQLANSPRLHASMTCFWILLVPVAHITGWVNSPAFISDLSLIALILSSGAWWAAAKVAKAQADDADVQEVKDEVDIVLERLDEHGRSAV